MRFEPFEDRVLIFREKVEQKGLIVIPDQFKEKAQVGTVIAISKGRYDSDGELVPSMLSTGEKILFGKYTGTEVKIDDIEYIIMREGDVLGILHEEEKH